MSDSIVTQLARPTDDPATRAAAVAYMTRNGYADLLPVLGLVEQPPRERVPCPSCGKPLPDPVTSGGRKPCQRRGCAAGPVARGVKR